MPFKSEAQRRYLWANEPEIARDWTDTYGSKIHAADGGIMRLGYQWGGPGGKSPGTSASHGQGSSRGPRDAPDRHGHTPTRNVHQTGAVTQTPGRTIGDDRFQNYATNPLAINTNVPPNEIGGQGYVPTQSKGFWGNLGTNIQNFNPLDYAPFVGKKSLSGMLTRGIGTFATDLFKGSGWDSSMGPRKDMGYNPNRINPFQKPDGGGDGQQQYPPWLYDAYAQNIVDDEELDIDTSTGDMEEWIQRFRVKDPYRQDQGGLDEQIREYVSKLYT